MSNELIDRYIIKKKMQQQVLQSIRCREESDNPQFAAIISDKKVKQRSKKKKQFKIKKSNLSKAKNSRKQQGFSNPIYAGLDGQESDNENRVNFGPWIHQVSDQTTFPSNPYQSIESKHPISHLKQQLITHYDKQIIDNNIMNQIQNGNEFKCVRKSIQQQIKCSSVTLEMNKTKMKNISLQPIKQPLSGRLQQQIQQVKKIGNKNRSVSSSIELLKYHSLKYLFEDKQKSYLGINTNNIISKSPNAVIYNYCCSSIDNNLFSSDLGNMLLNTQSNNKQTISILSDSKLLKEKKSNQKLTPISIRKNINKELYDELIKRKSRVK